MTPRNRRLAYALIAIAALVTVSFVFMQQQGRRQLNVLNWDFYIGKDTLSDFERDFDVRVNYEIYKDNEQCLAKIKANPNIYDVIFPSDYMIHIMKTEKLLAKLDHSRLKNLSNVGQEYRGNYYDMTENYSVPYMFGTTGFAINTEFVRDENITWALLAEKPEYQNRISIIDDLRFTLGSVLIEQGKSPNTRDKVDLDSAVSLLRKVRPNVKLFSADSPKDLLISGSIWIAYAWSGDTLQAQKGNPKVRYLIPKAGSLRFQDGICIPKGAPHGDLAHEFINYLLRDDVSAKITNDILYGNTNKAAYGSIRLEIRNNPASFPAPGDLQKLHWIEDVGESLKLYQNAWEEVKNDR
jgi:spermidine/putrescine transport system substrate-binding protein